MRQTALLSAILQILIVFLSLIYRLWVFLIRGFVSFYLHLPLMSEQFQWFNFSILLTHVSVELWFFILKRAWDSAINGRELDTENSMRAIISKQVWPHERCSLIFCIISRLFVLDGAQICTHTKACSRYWYWCCWYFYVIFSNFGFDYSHLTSVWFEYHFVYALKVNLPSYSLLEASELTAGKCCISPVPCSICKQLYR